MGESSKKSVLSKVKKLFKKEERKLLEKYEIVEEDSPNGVSEEGLILEELTDDGVRLLTMVLWTEHRPKVVEILKKVEVEDKKNRKHWWKDEEEEEKE